MQAKHLSYTFKKKKKDTWSVLALSVRLTNSDRRPLLINYMIQHADLCKSICKINE